MQAVPGREGWRVLSVTGAGPPVTVPMPRQRWGSTRTSGQARPTLEPGTARQSAAADKRTLKWRFMGSTTTFKSGCSENGDRTLADCV